MLIASPYIFAPTHFLTRPVGPQSSDLEVRSTICSRCTSGQKADCVYYVFYGKDVDRQLIYVQFQWDSIIYLSVSVAGYTTIASPSEVPKELIYMNILAGNPRDATSILSLYRLGGQVVNLLWIHGKMDLTGMFCDASIDFRTQGQVQDQQNLEPMSVPMSLPIASYFNQIIKDVPSKYFKPRRFQLF